jgi:hypothetical protein
MRRIPLVATLVAGALARPAAAEKVAPPASKPAETKPADSRPAPETADLKPFVGSWSCDSTARGAGGTALTSKSRLVTKWTLDSRWLAVHLERPRGKAPGVRAVDAFLGWDGPGKRYWMVGADNDGGWLQLTGPTWSGPSLTLTGEGIVDGQKVPLRLTLTRKGDRELMIATELQSGSPNWILVGQDTCRHS